MISRAMVSFGRKWSFLACGVLGLSGFASPIAAQDTSPDAPPAPVSNGIESVCDPRAWLPETTLLYAELAPAERWWDHPLREHLVSTEAFKNLWRSPDVLQARGGIFIAELALGAKLESIARELTAGGVFIAIDRETEGVVLLAHTESAQWLDGYIKKLVDYARNDAKSKGQSDPIRTAEYRGIQGYQWQNAIVGKLDAWLLVTNKSELARAVIDRKLDEELPDVAEAKWLQGFPNIAPQSGDTKSQRLAAVQMDLERIRPLARGNDLFRGQAKDFGAELILGGVLAVLQNASMANGCLEADERGLTTVWSTDCDPSWFGEAREHFVGPQMRGRAPQPLAIPGAIGLLTAYRNVSEMWLRAGDLFDQEVNDRMAEADNTLTTLFSGKDFATDILGAIQPEVQLVAVQQEFVADALAPTVQLPAFGLVATLKQPEAMKKELKRTFQSFLGFLNVVGAMEGNPQIDQNAEQRDGMTLYWGEYVPDAERKYENGLPIQFNFSPSIAFVGDQVIVASHVQLARQWAAHAALPEEEKSQSGESASKVWIPDANTWAAVDFQALKKILETNKNGLITQNMLEKGHSKAEASKEIGTLMDLLALLDRGSLQLRFSERAAIEVRIDVSKP